MAGVPMYASRQSAQTAYDAMVAELKRAMREAEEAVARGWGVDRTVTVSSMYVNGVPVNRPSGGVIFTVRFR